MGEDLKGSGKGGSGRLGAPYPQHKGIPAVHFERLTCTVCHSGALPDKPLDRVRTSRANRLGIYGVAQWSTTFPYVVEPVFKRDVTGRIAPHRLVWPSFWARKEGDGFLPLKPSQVSAAAAEVLNVAEDVARILIAISVHPEIPGIPVLVFSGKVYSPNLDGKLDSLSLLTEEALPDLYWGLRINEAIEPLIPDFDPHAEEPDMDAEIRIQSVLEGLWDMETRPGEPVLIYKGAKFHLVEGYLERSEISEQASAPPRLLWENQELSLPLISDFHIRTLVETSGSEQTLTEEQVEKVLKLLTAQEGEYVYIAKGKVFALDDTDSLSTTDHAAADPTTWPLGHQVRPAQQALGKKGCIQCHSESSAMFFARVESSGPLKTQQGIQLSMTSFMELDKPYQRLFGLSFRVRPLFKLFLLGCVGIVAAMLALVLLLALGRISGLIEKKT